MWLEATYKPVTLFSMKTSSATNSAAKTLPCPSPYAVKMSLLNAMITHKSLNYALERFHIIRGIEIRFALPDNWVVNNCLVRIMKLKRHDKAPNNDKKQTLQQDDPFQSTIAFREYVFFKGDLKIALSIPESIEQPLEKEDYLRWLRKWLLHINFFGKRGCFFQFVGSSISETLPNGYSQLLNDNLVAPGIIYPLDDVDHSAEFSNMNNYDHKTKAMRVKQIHLFPFKQISANKSYTQYRKL